MTPQINPLGWIVLAGLGATAIWLVVRPKKASASTKSCAVDLMKLHGWGIARERPVLYLPDRTAPSTEALETLPGVDELDMVAALNGTLVVVTSDGVFWNYEGEEPARDDALRADYCAFIGA